MNITIEFFILELVLAPIFSLNWKLQFSGPNLFKKGSYFQSKTDKIDTAIDFCIFELVLVPSFSLNWQFWFDQIFSFDQICPKRVFLVENRKSEHHIFST